MIISASRRTDIPAFYWEWFQKRLQEQYVLVRNPLNLHQVSRISLRPEVVDGLVFWTKNPEPMLKQLSVLDAYAYYFQFTLNAYAADVEAASAAGAEDRCGKNDLALRPYPVKCTL